MNKGRLEAFSDGVIAILITIMVLELKVPHGADWETLRELVPLFLSYIVSFVYVGIYWNNHHHMLHAAKRINGAILWANLHLLFWLSLIPFATGWAAENHGAPLPVALYGVILFFAGGAYAILQNEIIKEDGANSKLALAVRASRSVCCGWKPWENACDTTGSARQRSCHACARSRRACRPPAAS